LKLIIARATAGDAIWFKATIDRIAEILALQGDSDSVEVRRSKAIGILAQLARALQLLCEHQRDEWDGATEPAAAAEAAEPEHDAEPSDVAEPADLAEPADVTEAAGTAEGDHNAERDADHQSLRLDPPPFDPDRARPRAVVYVHLSSEALTNGSGVARLEDVGPVLLGRLRSVLGDRCMINLKPVIDLPAGPTLVDSYEIPARLREHLQLRYPADVFPYAAAGSRQIDVDHTIRYLSPDRGGPPCQTRIDNLGPQVRRHHGCKTHGGWQVRQPEPGTWLWRSPHRRIYLVTPVVLTHLVTLNSPR
jgi:hypothetical protein